MWHRTIGRFLLLILTIAAGLSAYGDDRLFRIWVDQPDGPSLYGFIDAHGQTVIAPRFTDVHHFSEGLARISIRESWAYIKRNGQVAFILPPEIVSASEFSDGLALINRGGETDYHRIIGGKWGFIDTSGRIVIEPRFTSRLDVPARSFSQGLAAARETGEWGFIDRSGEFTIRPQFQAVHSFSEGYAAVQLKEKWGFIDKTGRFVIPHRFESVHRFSEGLAAVRQPGKRGYINAAGELVIQLPGACDWDVYSDFRSGLAAVKLPAQGPLPPGSGCPNCGNLDEDLWFGDQCGECGHLIQRGLKWGFIDREGKQVIGAQFADARQFLEGVAAVQDSRSKLWGFIDRKGAYVIRPRFLSVPYHGFEGGLALVEAPVPQDGESEERRFEYINQRGEAVWRQLIPADDPAADTRSDKPTAR